jgi:hypothetical protein
MTTALLNTQITDVDTIEALPVGTILLEQIAQHPGQAMAWRKESDGWWYPSTFSWVRQRGALAMAGVKPTLIHLPTESAEKRPPAPYKHFIADMDAPAACGHVSGSMQCTLSRWLTTCPDCLEALRNENGAKLKPHDGDTATPARKLSPAQIRVLRDARRGNVGRAWSRWGDGQGRDVTRTVESLIARELAVAVSDRGRTELSPTDAGIDALTEADDA